MDSEYRRLLRVTVDQIAEHLGVDPWQRADLYTALDTAYTVVLEHARRHFTAETLIASVKEEMVEKCGGKCLCIKLSASGTSFDRQNVTPIDQKGKGKSDSLDLDLELAFLESMVDVCVLEHKNEETICLKLVVRKCSEDK